MVLPALYCRHRSGNGLRRHRGRELRKCEIGGYEGGTGASRLDGLSTHGYLASERRLR
jgi:hypothetical protein